MDADGAGEVRLRGHHLLCMLTYVGKGYSAGFVAAMTAVVGRIDAGARIRIVEGPDDICAAHVAGRSDPHCLRPRAHGRDLAALADIGALLETPLAPGAVIAAGPATVETLRRRFADGTIRRACSDCPWSDLCTDIAARGYPGTVLARPD